VKKKIFVYSSIIILSSFLYYTNVPTSLNDEDIEYIKLIFTPENLSNHNDSIENEILLIRKIQSRILATVNGSKGIELYHTREPKDLYEKGYGLCYDKSRTIEKTLNFLGYKTRHFSLYKLLEKSKFKTLTTPGGPSHAITEVLTKQGWMVVDPNINWIGYEHNNVLSIKDISKNRPQMCSKHPEQLYCDEFIYYYGIYSRHGKAYPPFINFPNVNWGDFLDNLFS
jgi:hypothetical protein